MWQTISSGEPWSSVVIEKRKNGTFYPAMLSIAPIMDDSGEITNYVGYHQDITEQQNMEKQFRQAQKREAIGTLVGGIAHDFKQFGYISAIACR
ncbi:MAG: PAS domain-containing protein [Mariprofundaceae bacterium]|nr:PAS domain-containing protein [Mariprofundaceae bacterium]